MFTIKPTYAARFRDADLARRRSARGRVHRPTSAVLSPRHRGSADAALPRGDPLDVLRAIPLRSPSLPYHPRLTFGSGLVSSSCTGRMPFTGYGRAPRSVRSTAAAATLTRGGGRLRALFADVAPYFLLHRCRAARVHFGMGRNERIGSVSRVRSRRAAAAERCSSADARSRNGDQNPTAIPPTARSR